MRFTSFLLALGFTLAFSGCGDDDVTVTDGGGGDVDGGGGGGDCAGMADGTSCGDGLICVSGVCETSGCGDAFVDTASGEQCDDGNDDPTDGCTSACTFTCEADDVCGDDIPCNGVESCNLTAHRCQENAVVPGTECTLTAGGMGVCTATGACAAPGCGNGVMDAGEDCDDSANGDQTDGCKDDCTFTCATNEECLDTDACNGEETCDVSTHMCVGAETLDCNDMDPCSSDACDMEMGCQNTLVDIDGDGFAPGMCAAGSMFTGGDCLDTNGSVYPGAPELCDSLDNNCNGMVDDMTVSVMCYRDADGDGYGLMSMVTDACTCPAGSIPPRADGEFDCKDSGTSAMSVNPAATAYQTRSHCGGSVRCPTGVPPFDYNCDGTETKQYPSAAASGCTLITLFGTRSCLGSGWETAVPACGVAASYKTCSVANLLGTYICRSSTASRTQACR